MVHCSANAHVYEKEILVKYDTHYVEHSMSKLLFFNLCQVQDLNCALDARCSSEPPT